MKPHSPKPLSRRGSPRAKSVDEYIAGIPRPHRTGLEKLRQAIRAAAPGAEEVISYGLPSVRQGRVLVSYGATAGHCAFYVMSTDVVRAHRKELEGYDTSPGTVRFAPEDSLPQALVRKLVKARLKECGVED